MEGRKVLWECVESVEGMPRFALGSPGKLCGDLGTRKMILKRQPGISQVLRGYGSEGRRNELEHAVETKKGQDKLALKSKGFIFACEEGTGWRTWVEGQRSMGEKLIWQMGLDKQESGHEESHVLRKLGFILSHDKELVNNF